MIKQNLYCPTISYYSTDIQKYNTIFLTFRTTHHGTGLTTSRTCSSSSLRPSTPWWRTWSSRGMLCSMCLTTPLMDGSDSRRPGLMLSMLLILLTGMLYWGTITIIRSLWYYCKGKGTFLYGKTKTSPFFANFSIFCHTPFLFLATWIFSGLNTAPINGLILKIIVLTIIRFICFYCWLQ